MEWTEDGLRWLKDVYKMELTQCQQGQRVTLANFLAYCCLRLLTERTHWTQSINALIPNEHQASDAFPHISCHVPREQDDGHILGAFSWRTFLRHILGANSWGKALRDYPVLSVIQAHPQKTFQTRYAAMCPRPPLLKRNHLSPSLKFLSFSPISLPIESRVALQMWFTCSIVLFIL